MLSQIIKIMPLSEAHSVPRDVREELTLTNVKRSGDRKSKFSDAHNAVENVNPIPFRSPDMFSTNTQT